MKTSKRLLEDMLHAIQTIETYQVSSYEQFVHDGRTQDAIMFNLIILGEAANKIPRDFHETHS